MVMRWCVCKREGGGRGHGTEVVPLLLAHFHFYDDSINVEKHIDIFRAICATSKTFSRDIHAFSNKTTQISILHTSQMAAYIYWAGLPVLWKGMPYLVRERFILGQHAVVQAAQLLTLHCEWGCFVGGPLVRRGSHLLSACLWLSSFAPARPPLRPPGSSVLSPCSRGSPHKTHQLMLSIIIQLKFN